VYVTRSRSYIETYVVDIFACARIATESLGADLLYCDPMLWVDEREKNERTTEKGSRKMMLG